jgi:phytoene dehydrogenase-like protein
VRRAESWDAIVIGSGPNGLTAAATVAAAGFSVLVLEAAAELGGGVKTLPLTLPGFLHDVCSAIHPLAISSPALLAMPLAQYGLEWIQPDIPVAHPLDGGRAVFLQRSVRETAASLGGDGEAYSRLLAPAVQNWDLLTNGRLRVPRSVIGLIGFGLAATRPALSLLESRFRAVEARALLAGLAGHSVLGLEDPLSAGFGMVLGAAGHAVGWPFPRGGAGQLATALTAHLRSLGVVLKAGARVDSLDDLPPHRVVLCDLSPREVVRIAGDRFPSSYRRQLTDFIYGPGVCKVDWALDSAIPWAAAGVGRAGTVHLGGTAEEIAESEHAVWEGRCSDQPFVIAAQHTPFDPSRAPAGKHTAWAYCHVPNGSALDMTERIEAQIERFAPGFRDRILGRSTIGPADLEQRNRNLAGGDITGGANTWRQMIARPTPLAYVTPDRRVLLCSASTPPGGGVHGLCGYFAARLALRRLRRG